MDRPLKIYRALISEDLGWSCFFFLLLGAQRLASRQVLEWTTVTEKQFSISVSPYIACVEAERSEDEQNKRHHNINVNNTPKARPGRPKGAKRRATGIRKSSKIGKRRWILSFHLICNLLAIASRRKCHDPIFRYSVSWQFTSQLGIESSRRNFACLERRGGRGTILFIYIYIASPAQGVTHHWQEIESKKWEGK